MPSVRRRTVSGSVKRFDRGDAVTTTREQMYEALMAEIARQDFGDFSKRVSPGTYEQPAHVLKLIEYLEALERRDITRLIVEFPPRSSKTTHVSRLFPAWWMGRHPEDGVILGSYSDTLATDNGRAVRDYISERAYPFPTKVRADVKSAGRWQTNQGGGLIAVGVGTGLTGWPFPGRLAVVDDPVKGREDAESEVVRENTWLWWQETLLTRLAADGVLIAAGTRWHEDDLIGRILNSKGASDWARLRLPYLAEPDDPLDRMPNEKLKVYGTVPSVEKGEISAYGFSALYQQRPTPAGGGVFKKAWMERRYCTCGNPGKCGLKILPDKGPRWTVIQAADLGGKQGVGHDPSALATWGWDGISKYLLDYSAKQDEYVDVKARFLASHFQWRPRMTYVEDATWAQPLISDLRAAGVKTYAVPAHGSKWTRADAIANEFEGGMVLLPESAPWLDAWLHEHLAFPNAQHDEAVDTTSLALSVLRATPSRSQRRTLAEQAIPDRRTVADRMLERLKMRRRA